MRPYLIIICAAALLFIPFLGGAHLFDWDEINFAECAREMIVSGDYFRPMIDFKPFWEKPPVFIWMQVLSMKVFGINEFAARFPNAMIGIATLCSFFAIGKRLVSEKFAWVWVILYTASWLPHFYFKSGIIDPSFNLFIYLAIYFAFNVSHTTKKLLCAVLSGIFVGLAVLTKGPVAIAVCLLTLLVFCIVRKTLLPFAPKYFIALLLSGIATTMLWFGAEIMAHGWWFVNEFITYQIRLFKTEDAGHGGPFIYHFIVLLLGCFPASIFLFTYIKKSAPLFQDDKLKTSAKNFRTWNWILFWVVLLLFSIVKTKIVHYSSLCYFPLSYLAALPVYQLINRKLDLTGWQKVLLLGIGAVVAIAITLLPWVGLHKELLIPLIDDPFAVGNLQADVPWSYWEMSFGIIYLIALVAVYFLIREKFYLRGLSILACAQVFIIFVTVSHFTPKIEAISQRAAIEYFESFAGEDVYVQVLGYKSYAHLFYTKKKAPTNPNYYNQDWLIAGPVDKPVYFICKIQNAASTLEQHPTLMKIGEKNGFVFLKRK